jgi:hypothetical protein
MNQDEKRSNPDRSGQDRRSGIDTRTAEEWKSTGEPDRRVRSNDFCNFNRGNFGLTSHRSKNNPEQQTARGEITYSHGGLVCRTESGRAQQGGRRRQQRSCARGNLRGGGEVEHRRGLGVDDQLELARLLAKVPSSHSASRARVETVQERPESWSRELGQIAPAAHCPKHRILGTVFFPGRPQTLPACRAVVGGASAPKHTS